MPIYQNQFIQSRVQYTNVWSIQSLDIVIGLVGGVSAVVWAVLDKLLGDYEKFMYENSIVGSIYPTS